jgi:hypothetical protein
LSSIPLNISCQLCCDFVNVHLCVGMRVCVCLRRLSLSLSRASHEIHTLIHMSKNSLGFKKTVKSLSIQKYRVTPELCAICWSQGQLYYLVPCVMFFFIFHFALYI